MRATGSYVGVARGGMVVARAGVMEGTRVVGMVRVGMEVGSGVGRLRLGTVGAGMERLGALRLGIVTFGAVGVGMLRLGMPKLGTANEGAGATAEVLLAEDGAEVLPPVGAGIPAEGALADGNGSGSSVGTGMMIGIGVKVGAVLLALLERVWVGR